MEDNDYKKLENDLLPKLDRLAWLLDSSIKVPGTPWRIGLDGLIGLIPGVGDLTGGALSSYIILHAVRAGVSPFVIANMALNVILESVVGIIPVVGDIFDFAFKANLRNVALMRNYLNSPAAVKKQSIIKVLLSGLIVLGMFALIIFLIALMVSVLLSAIN